MLHRIRQSGWRGIESLDLYLEPGARVLFGSELCGAGKSSIHSGIAMTLMGRCQGTDAAGRGAKALIHHGTPTALLAVEIARNGNTVGFGRRIADVGSIATCVSDNGGSPDWSAPLDDVIEHEFGVAPDGLLPLLYPLDYLGMKPDDQQGVHLAACGRFTYAELERRTGKPITELQALAPTAEGQPLRIGIKRIGAAVTKARRQADTDLTAAQRVAAELKGFTAGGTAPTSEALAEARDAAKKAQEKYQGYVRRCSEAGDAQAALTAAKKARAKLAADQGTSGPTFVALHEARGRLKDADVALGKTNDRRVQAGLAAVASYEELGTPPDSVNAIETLRHGCVVCRTLAEHHDGDCDYAAGDPEAADALAGELTAVDELYAAALEALRDLDQAQADVARYNREIEEGKPLQADAVRQADAAIAAAEERVKQAKPVKESTLARLSAKLKMDQAQAALVDLQAASKSAAQFADAGERLASAEEDMKRASRLQKQWGGWEKLVNPSGRIMQEWAGEVVTRYQTELPGALAALSAGVLELGTGDGPIVNGRHWLALSDGERLLLGIAVAAAWGRAIGVKLMCVDNVDKLGAALPRVLQVLAGGDGTVLLFAVGAEAMAMAEQAGWGVHRL